MNDQEIRAIAKKQLNKQRDFKQYLWIWAGVSLLLTSIWFLVSPEEYFWPVWAILGMGIGAFFTGIDAYSKGSRAITEAQIDAEVKRLTGK